MRRKTFHSEDKLVRTLYGMAMAVLPKASYLNIEPLIGIVRAATLAELKIPFTPEQIGNTTPSSGVIRMMTRRFAAQTLYRNMSDAVEAEYVSLACDKAPKNGLGIFIKMLCNWNSKRGCVRAFLLDNYVTGNSSKEAAESIQNSFHTIGFKDLKLSGQGTDNGGGGVVEGLAVELEVLGLCNDYFYFISNCTLHNLQLVFAVPVEKVFGLGGLNNYNFMQMAHSLYNIEDYLDKDTLFVGYLKRAKERLTTDFPETKTVALPEKKMPAPVTTRWWWLAIALLMIISHWKLYRMLVQMLLFIFSTKSYVGTVASNLDAMMREEEFYLKAYFVCVFGQEFIMKHFGWLQDKGERSAVGFRSKEILVRYFLMRQELVSLMDGGWRTDPRFEAFVEALYRDRTLPPPPSEAFPWKSRSEEQQEMDDAAAAYLVGPETIVKRVEPFTKEETRMKKVSY